VGDGEVHRGDAGDIVVVEKQRHGGRQTILKVALPILIGWGKHHSNL